MTTKTIKNNNNNKNNTTKITITTTTTTTTINTAYSFLPALPLPLAHLTCDHAHILPDSGPIFHWIEARFLAGFGGEFGVSSGVAKEEF